MYISLPIYSPCIHSTYMYASVSPKGGKCGEVHETRISLCHKKASTECACVMHACMDYGIVCS